MKTRKHQCRIQLAASEPVAYRLVDLYFCRWQYWSIFITFHAIIFKIWTPWV